jgi:hypothetical protein
MRSRTKPRAVASPQQQLEFHRALKLLGRRRTSRETRNALRWWRAAEKTYDALIAAGERRGGRYEHALASVRAYKKLAGAQIQADLIAAGVFNSLDDHVLDEHGTVMDDVTTVRAELHYMRNQRLPPRTFLQRLLGQP